MNVFTKRLIVLAIIFSWFFILPVVIFSQPLDDDNGEEEEPVQSYPNPMERQLSDAKAMQIMKTQLTEMGFTVGKVRKVANGKFVVTVTSWNKAKMKPRYQDSVGTVKTKGKVIRGKGQISVTVNKQGIFMNNTSFKAMGLKLNAVKMKQGAKLKAVK
jgi:hypothetical protein